MGGRGGSGASRSPHAHSRIPSAAAEPSEERREAERRVEAERGTARLRQPTRVEQRGIEHPATRAPNVAKRREDDAKQTTQGNARRREVSASGDVVEHALARAIEAEVEER